MNFSNVVRIFVLVGMLLSLSGCNGDNSSEDIKLIAELKIENQNLNEQIKSMQIQEEPIALEAQRIRSVGILIQSVARQPEMADQLTELFEKNTNFSGQLIEDPNKYLIRARIIALGRLIEGSARQPEMAPRLEKVFTQYTGSLNPGLIKGDTMSLYYRNLIIGKLLEATARQPEMADLLKGFVDSYLGKYEYYESEGAAVTDPLVLAGRVQVVGEFFESSLRQPEMKDLLSQMLIEYSGDNDLLLNSSHCLVNRARIDVSSALIENVARWGSDDLGFEEQIVDLIGNVQPEPNSKGCSLPESLVHIY